MIIPILDGLLTFSKAPITWILLLLNVFLFSQNYHLAQDCHAQFETWYADSEFLYTQGQIYSQFQTKRDLAQFKDIKNLGRMAFRDEAFLNKAVLTPWTGDQIAIKDWKSGLEEYMVIRDYYPPVLYGISEKNKDFLAHLSYQFYHESFYHLLGNLLLILIIGAYLERRTSGLVVFSVYILGGGLAAFVLSFSGGLTAAPLIGASGSLCALLGFLLITELKTKTRLFYILLPIKGYMGFIVIPTVYWVIWLFVIEDIAGYVSQTSLISTGVAHSIHLLGFVVGTLLGWIYMRLTDLKWVSPRKFKNSYKISNLQKI